jgi:hypothetical protein
MFFGTKNHKQAHPRDNQATVTLDARPLFSTAAQKLRKSEHNECSFSNINSHRNRLLLFAKHLAVRILPGL